MKKILENKLLYLFIFFVLLIFITPSKQELINKSINNKLKLFEKNYDSNTDLNIYLINYYSIKKKHK